MMKFFYIALICLVTACTMDGAAVRPLNPPNMPAGPQGGPQEFQLGWHDGCETGMAAHGDDVYRTSYKFTQNPSLVMNPIYYKAWKDAENFCRTYIYEYTLRGSYIYCSLDGLVNDCADLDKTPGPFMGGKTGDDISNGVFGGGGGGVGSVMGDPKPGTGAGITGIIGTGEDTPFFGGAKDSSILGNW